MDRILASVAETINKSKGDNTVILDMRSIQARFCDFFVITTAKTKYHMEALSQEISEELEKMGMLPHHIEGTKDSRWVLMDYGYFVVHIFTEGGRGFYALENLWHDARRIEVKDEA